MDATLDFRRWFLIIFAFCCVVLNIVAFILYKKNQEIAEAREWVTHTYDVISWEDSMFSKIQDMITSQRGFLLTGNPKSLTTYKRNKELTLQEYNYVLKLTGDNEARQKEYKEYKAAIDDLVAILEKRIELKKKDQLKLDQADLNDSKIVMDKIRKFHAEIIAAERTLLNARANQESKKQKNYVLTIFTSAALSIIGLIIANGIVYFLTWKRRLADEELKRMNKEMEGFTYIASHDLRSPLVNLKGFASEMQYGINELTPLVKEASQNLPEASQKKIIKILEEDIADSLHYVHSSVQKMDKLTNAILELSRIGRRNLNVELVDPARIVRHILDTLHHTVTSKGIKVVLHPMPTVNADPLSLEQVFGNVIDNAIKYLDPKRPGVIEIGGHKSYRETKFWVKDNGRGISPYDMERIFEIYRRGGGNQDIPGEGMGMAYVRTTLRRLGGTIWCESHEGQGTIFYFTVTNHLKKEDKS